MGACCVSHICSKKVSHPRFDLRANNGFLEHLWFGRIEILDAEGVESEMWINIDPGSPATDRDINLWLLTIKSFGKICE